MEVRGSGGQVWDTEVAAGFRGRFAGLMGRPPRALLLATNRAHGFWLRAPIRLVGANRHGEVIAVRILARRRLAHIPGADWILELPLDALCPVPGDLLVAPAVFAHRSGRIR